MLVLGLVAACAARRGPSTEVYVHDDATIVAASPLLPVPLVSQATVYSCGDAAVLAVLRYYLPDRYRGVAEAALYGPLHTTSENGTEPAPMAMYLAQALGVAVDARWSTPSDSVTLDDVKQAIDRGDPPILSIQAWQAVAALSDLSPWDRDWNDGHYVVAVAYDAHNLYFMDPSTDGHYAYIPIAELLARWHDVVGPGNVQAQHIAIFARHARGPAAALPRQAVTAIH